MGSGICRESIQESLIMNQYQMSFMTNVKTVTVSPLRFGRTWETKFTTVFVSSKPCFIISGEKEKLPRTA